LPKFSVRSSFVCFILSKYLEKNIERSPTKNFVIGDCNKTVDNYLPQKKGVVMFNLIKPGHVLRFGTCPSTINSPAATPTIFNNNGLETLWPATSNLGVVQCLSHPSGNIGAIAADVATALRTTPGSIQRSTSYSGVGRLFTNSDRPVGQMNCDFVGYVDGRSNYIPSARTVFSKDFSGCLMVEYTVGGQRRVAHVAASHVPEMNCKQAFLTTLQGMGAVLTHGWFRPFDNVADGARKVTAFAVIGRYIQRQINNLVTFGVVTATGQAYSIDAFKPYGISGNDWVVTAISPKVMSQSWNAP
jgi:hypothetical protein